MIKALIIGCGKIAGILDFDSSGQVYSHAHAYQQSPFFHLICCVDIDIEKAKLLSNKYDCPYSSDDFLDALNAYKPDVISICTPDSTHSEVVLKILNNEIVPRVIFIEKPVCDNLNELNEMIHLSEKRNVEILVNHTRRFDGAHCYIRKLIGDNHFGRLIRGDVFYYSGWKHNGVHVVDTLNFIFDDDAQVETIYQKKDSPYPDDPTIDLKLVLKKQNARVFLHSFDEKYYQLFEFDLKFSRSRLRIEDFGNRIIFEKKSVNELGENVVVPENLQLDGGNRSPMETAIDLIGRYISFNSESILTGYRLIDVTKTMKTIWNFENGTVNKFE